MNISSPVVGILLGCSPFRTPCPFPSISVAISAVDMQDQYAVATFSSLVATATSASSFDML
jgi:hypothetical protein